jgi:hypothetical protein
LARSSIRSITSFSGAALGAEHRLALLVAEQAELREHRRQALEVLGGEERVGALLHVGRLGGGLLEAVEDLGQHCPRTSAAVLPTSTARSPGCGRCPEVDAAREARGLEQAAKLVAVAAHANWRSSAMRAGVSSPFVSRSLRASISLLRNSSTVSRSIASVSAMAQKTCLRSCWLRSRSSAASAVELLAVLGEVDLEHHVAR